MFTRKVGMGELQLPVWMWGIVAAVGYYAYSHLSGKTATSTSGQAAAAPSIDPQTGAAYASEYGAAQQQVDQLSAGQAYQPYADTGAAVAAATPAAQGSLATSGTPVTGTVTQYPAPSGVNITNITGSTASVTFPAITAPSAPATYTIAVYNPTGIIVSEQVATPVGGTVTAQLTGLSPHTKYTVSAWANGGSQAPPGASATFQTP
jgi:hypothetical protein